MAFYQSWVPYSHEDSLPVIFLSGMGLIVVIPFLLSMLFRLIGKRDDAAQQRSRLTFISTIHLGVVLVCAIAFVYTYSNSLSIEPNVYQKVVPAGE
jgi:uncharacterized membrane protein